MSDRVVNSPEKSGELPPPTTTTAPTPASATTPASASTSASATTPAATSVAGPGAEPARASAAFIAIYILALFGSYVAIITPSVVSLALKIQQIDPDGKVGSLSLVLSVGALCAVLANPLFGKLSDRTTSRFGMRRPWMIAGLIGGGAGLAMVAGAVNTGMVLIGWCVAQTFFNALLAPLVAVLPDQIPPRQRGVVGGLMGICYPVGLILGTWIAQRMAASAPQAMILAPMVIAAATVLLLCVKLKDRRLDPADQQPWNLREFLRTFWFNPRKNPDFGWAILSILLVSTAIMTFVTYQVYYLSDYLHIGESRLPALTFVLTLVVNGTSALTALVSGWLSDRYHRRKFSMVFAAVLAIAGFVILISTRSLPGMFVGATVLGLGNGFFYSGHYTLPSSVLPSEQDSAKDMGVANIAVTLPSSLVPIYAPTLLGLGGGDSYPALFVSGIVLALLGIPVVKRVRGVS
ncbi:MFS transporter [Streptomyces iconiensis]|uniref:MFS transporter n=1 Tax=Streptomyces iconiensis TaxID=1384038 RepID=A0ABT6ZPK9_9ACTN|nr:MFS transporter [Streptomyces iconiensis]MDJ1130981.1 MFS transporter [Streptomyces iconiensis]